MEKAQQTPNNVELPLEVARAVVAYLGARPYNEVAVLISSVGGALRQWEERELAGGGDG